MMDEQDRKNLPQWARERLEAEEQMGELESSASPGTLLAGVVVLVLEIALFLAGCAIVYLVGRALIGD